MLLAIDVGNTDTVLGLFKNSFLRATYRIPTKKLFPYLLSHHTKFRECHHVIVSSVVPVVDKRLKRYFQKNLGIKNPLFVSHQMKLPIKLTVDNPGEVGADRIVNDSYAYDRYRSDVLVIDFGTATTMDYINAKGQYRGGVIIPGIKTSMNALIEKAAKLKPFLFKRPKKILGRNTLSQLQSGAFIAHAAMIDGMIERIRKETYTYPKTIATGGLASSIAPLTKHLKVIDPYLTLKGLQLLHSFNVLRDK